MIKDMGFNVSTVSSRNSVPKKSWCDRQAPTDTALNVLSNDQVFSLLISSPDSVGLPKKSGRGSRSGRGRFCCRIRGCRITSNGQRFILPCRESAGRPVEDESLSFLLVRFEIFQCWRGVLFHFFKEIRHHFFIWTSNRANYGDNQPVRKVGLLVKDAHHHDNGLIHINFCFPSVWHKIALSWLMSNKIIPTSLFAIWYESGLGGTGTQSTRCSCWFGVVFFPDIPPGFLKKISNLYHADFQQSA